MTMQRYKKLVLEAQKGIAFEQSEGTNGELIWRAVNIAKTKASSQKRVTVSKKDAFTVEKNSNENQYANYANPPVPPGYEHIGGTRKNGFVIESPHAGQFVWIPVVDLKANGTLDGNSFNQKFGRRNYRSEEFSDAAYHETVTAEFEMQMESVERNGGFYISCYEISKNKDTGKLQSVRFGIPIHRIDFYEAMEKAYQIENGPSLKSHIPFGAEYDSMLEWIIESNARNYDEVVKDSTNWGNYISYGILRKTGSAANCSNNLYDVSGNLREWTQEEYGSSYKGSSYRVIRGGSYLDEGKDCPAAYRTYCSTAEKLRGHCAAVGFRLALCLR